MKELLLKVSLGCSLTFVTENSNGLSMLGKVCAFYKKGALNVREQINNDKREVQKQCPSLVFFSSTA